MASLGHSWSASRLSGAGFVVLLHVVLIGALVTSLGHMPIAVIPPDLVIRTLPAVKDPFIPPPAAPVIDPQPLPPSMPDFVVETPSTGAGGLTVTRYVPPAADPRHANARPDYPEASVRLGEEGSVVLTVLVDVNGRVTDARIDQTSGYDRLDRGALNEALRSYRFVPGTENGQPRAMWHKIKVTFRLEDARG